MKIGFLTYSENKLRNQYAFFKIIVSRLLRFRVSEVSHDSEFSVKKYRIVKSPLRLNDLIEIGKKPICCCAKLFKPLGYNLINIDPVKRFSKCDKSGAQPVTVEPGIPVFPPGGVIPLAPEK